MTTCTFPDCGRAPHARGLCASHWRQQWNGRPLTPIRTYSRAGYPAEVLIQDLEALIGTDTADHIADRLGLKLLSIQRQLTRARRWDLWRKLNGKTAS